MQLVAESTDEEEGPVDLVTAIPGVDDLSQCWSHSEDDPLSLEAAEVLEKCLQWNYNNAVDIWSKLA